MNGEKKEIENSIDTTNKLGAKVGFDSALYLSLQTKKIRERLNNFGDKLYLEFGGKLFDDYHASRVLPGFSPDNKIKMLTELVDECEIVIVINSSDIIKNKLRSDTGITYKQDILRLIDEFRNRGFLLNSVVISRYLSGNPVIVEFEKRLKKFGIKVARHYSIDGYPRDIDKIVSDSGLGKNDYIETSRRIIVVTAPGPSSGKMATCLSQLYHDHKRGISSGYAKYETFPIWNLPLSHPVNLAYEAATADIADLNMIDPFHLNAYNEIAVNYNRDIEIFPVLNTLFEKLLGVSPYKSPTDMGVNAAGFAIKNDTICSTAANQEIIRRFLQAQVGERKGSHTSAEVEKLQDLMQRQNLNVTDRRVVVAARLSSKKNGDTPAAAIELPDGRIVCGKTSDLLGCSCAALLNALKTLSGIDDKIKLISPLAIEPIQKLKTKYLGGQNPRLHTDEVLIALSISAAESIITKLALENLPQLSQCEVHTTTILSPVDESVFRRIGCRVTSEPVYSTKKLYQK